MSDPTGVPRAQSVSEVAGLAVQHIPPECRFTEGDAEVIHRHRDLLLSLEPKVIESFYDTLYSHPPTAAVFVDGERPDREKTLSDWWRKTVEGPLDDQYFAWMALVGLVHVARGVENPSMLAMADHTAEMVGGSLNHAGLDPAEAETLVEAFRRLTSTVGAIITFGYTYGYDEAVGAALYDIAGMPERLVRRLRDQQIATAIARGRVQMDEGRSAPS
jgi:hypothetical protein